MESTDPQSQAGEQPSDDVPQRTARREALKKAAAGAAVAGAVWTAPAVRGLTPLPDYAAAGTGTATRVFLIRTADWGNSNCPGYYCTGDNSGDEVPACPGSGGSVWRAQGPDNPGITINSAGPTGGNPATNLSMTAPLVSPTSAPIGSVNLAIGVGPNNQGELNDTRNDINMVINVDPPWNKCRVSSAVLTKCNGSTGTININNNPPTGPNTSGSYPVGFTIPGPQPNFVSYVTITVSCT